MCYSVTFRSAVWNFFKMYSTLSSAIWDEELCKCSYASTKFTFQKLIMLPISLGRLVTYLCLLLKINSFNFQEMKQC